MTDQNPIAETITLLTTAARRTRVIGPGEQTAPVDFAEIACRVMASVAANVGGVEALLAGRPGSWEAAVLRDMLTATVGHDHSPETLLPWRTEPLQIVLDTDSVFEQFGLLDLHDQAVDALNEAYDEANEAMFDAVATAHEKARRAELAAVMPPLFSGPNAEQERAAELMSEIWTIASAVAERAASTGHPLAADLAACRAASRALGELWEQDQATYREAYTEAVRRAVAERGLTVPVDVVDRDSSEPDPDPWGLFAQFTDDLGEQALARAPLPMTGQPPDWSDGTPADALDRAGLGYTERAREAATAASRQSPEAGQ